MPMVEFNDALRAWVARSYPDEAEGFVPGEGNVRARVALVGEAPGAQEALQGRPFVGKAGRNLDMFLTLAGLERDDMYVTNAVKFRPTRLSKSGNRVNRPPTRAEIEAFRPWLMEELQIVSPEWVVTMGNVPLQAVLGRG
ncbi:MAG: uracil-DNA glycosylase, partial [Clostridiales bacterium]|nr:uracil-DNA glycosylase [Clostridiales bacterium]